MKPTAFLETGKIEDIWSTDQHLGLTGAQVLPRSYRAEHDL